ncbi:MAG: helix-turn-helix domain-containing protein [Jatrophihabitans sp.]
MKTGPSQFAEIDWPQLPRRWRETLVPAALPGLSREIVAVIRQQIPEYRRSLDGPYGKATRRGVEEALTVFVDQVTRSGALSPAHLELFRGLGRGEAMEGRSHDALQSAYRIGSKLAWRRIISINDVEPLPPDTVARLAAAVFGFVDHLAAVSAAGFSEAQLQGAELDTRRRNRLLQLLLDQPASPSAAITELSDRLNWPLPDEVVLIDVIESADLDDRALAELARLIFGPAALGGRVSAGSVLLVPGPMDEAGWVRLAGAKSAPRLCVGCPVPLAQAPASLRWAQLAARLTDTGVLRDGTQMIFSSEHLPLLLLHSERALHDQLVRRRLGPLLALSQAKRLKFARLLSTWLELGCTQGELAGILQVHRQTVHYQVGRLQAMFGEQLHDRTARVELLLALRAALPEWEQAES